MKKIFFFLMLLTGLATMTVSAQQTLTVADGTTTNGYVPVYGYYEDAFLQSQTIYPASLLTSMVGEPIQSMTFYLTSSAILTSTFAVKVGTTTDATFGTAFLTSPSTTVYTGTFTVSNNQITLNFSTPFQYTGGNLLVEVSTVSTTGDNYSETEFYGISSTGSSISGYSYSGISSITSPSVRNFIPKTTFNYGTISCYVPSDFSVLASEINSITLNWRDVNNTGATYTIYDMSDTSVVASGITDTTYEVMGLTAATNYTFGIVADCGGGDMSNMVTVQAQTSACALTDQCSYTIVKNDSYGDGWNGAAINVYANNMLVATLGLTSGYTATETLNVCDNTTLSFVWASGNFDYEASFSIYDINSILIFSTDDASTLTSSNFFTTLTNCTPASCMPVTAFTVDSTTVSSIFLSWTDTINTYATYTIYDMSDTSVVISGLSSTDYEVTNLTANTLYNFGVAADCGSGDMSFMMMVSGRTDCAMLTTLPYTCGFEANELPSSESYLLPICWTKYNDSNGSSNYYPYAYSNYPHTGSRALYFYSYSSSSYADTMMAVLPPLDNTIYPMNGNQLCFWMRTTSTSYTYKVFVGTLSDPTDPSTFVTAQAIDVTGTTYNQYEVLLTNAPAGNNYVAIMVPRQTNSGSIYIDDVTLMEIPTCPAPTQFEVSNLTSSSATFTWHEVASAQQWEIAYGQAGFNPDATTANFNTVTANDTTVTINNLVSGTLYHAYLRANCGTNDNSEWRGPLSLAPGSYNMQNVGWDTLYSCGAVIYDDGGATGNYSNNCDSYLVIYPDQPGNMVSVSGTLTAESSTWDYLVIYDGDSAGTANQLFKTSQTGASSPFTIPAITSTTGPLTIYFHTDNSGQYPGFELVTTCYSCYAPAITVSNVTSSEATVFWSSFTGTETDFEVAYGPVGFNPDTVQPENASGYSYDITGLTSDMAYDVYVRTSCGGNSYSSWSTVQHFTTLPTCPVPTGLTNLTLTTTSADISWTHGGQESEWEVMLGNNSLGSVYDTLLPLTNLTPETNYSIKVRAICGAGDTSAWSSTLSIFTGYCQPNPSSVDNNGITNVTFGNAPEVVNNSPANSGNITYGNYASQVGAVAAGTIANVDITYGTGYSYGTLIWVDWNNNLTFDDNEIVYTGTSASTNPTTLNASFTVPATQDTGLYRMRIGGADSYFDSYIGGNTSAAHDPCSGGSYKVFHDYTLHVTEAPNCLAVTNLAVGAATDNSITLVWSDDLNIGATYTVYDMSDSSVLASGITDTTFTVTSLTSNTGYTFAVETDCGGGDLSGIVTVTAHTECGIQTIPFTEGFENGIDCWTLNNCNSNTGVNILAANTGSYGFRFYYTTNYPQYLISPQFAAATTPLQLEFDYGSNSTNYTETFKVGYSTTTSNVTAFTWGNEISITGSSNWMHYSDLIPAGAKYIAIQCTSDDQLYLYIDNISIDVPPTCITVTNLTVSATTATSITLTWTDANNTGATYTIYDMANASTPIAQNVSATTYTVTGLTAATAYTFGVEANCTPTDASTIATVTTSTECADITTFPYTEGFENGLGCWQTVDNDGDGIAWLAATSSTELPAHTGNGMIASLSYYSGALYPDNYLISPKLILPASSTITLSWYFMVDPSYPADKYSVYVSTGNSVTDFTTPLFTIVPTSTHGTWTQQTLDLSAYAGQQVYVAFRHYDCSDEDLIVLDDITITAVGGTPQPDTCLAPSNLTVTGMTQNSVVLNWTENGDATSWTVNYKEDNASNWSTTTVSSKPYTLTGLQPGTNYLVYVVANCADGQSDPSTTVTFATLADGIADYELATSLYPNPNNGQFTIYNEQFTINNVNVYDVYGKLLKTVEVNANSVMVDANELSAGMYFVRISTEKGVVTKSFVKK